MRKGYKKIFILLCALLVVTLSSIVVNAETIGGSCGENLEWTYSDETLTISGSGAMEDYGGTSYGNPTNLPWSAYVSTAKKIVIGEGITYVGNKAFYGCKSATDIIFPSTVTTLGSWAFNGCYKLTYLTIPKNITTLAGGGVFADSINLKDVFYTGSKEEWEAMSDTGPYRNYARIHYNSTWHSIEKISAVPVTCEKDGIIEHYKCSVCGQLFSDAEGRIFTDESSVTIPSEGHKWNTEYITDFDSTCISAGQKSIHCSVCNEIKYGSAIPIDLKPHNFGGWTKVKEPSCVDAGTEERYCTYCSLREVKEIPALGHTWNNEPTVDEPATCTEVGVQSIHCARCDVTQEASIIPPLGHKWNTTYTVDVPATKSAAGSQSIHCSVCGAIKEGSSETIPKLTPTTPTAPTEIADLPTVKISKPKAAKKKITVKWKKVSKKNQKRIKGIEIQVATDKNFKNIVKTAYAGKKKTSKVIKGLKSKTKYYVRIRAYAAGNHVSNWKSKSVKVK